MREETKYLFSLKIFNSTQTLEQQPFTASRLSMYRVIVQFCLLNRKNAQKYLCFQEYHNISKQLFRSI